MKVNQLILIIRRKLEKNIKLEQLIIEDKSFLHKNHKTNHEGKFHLKLSIHSKQLKETNKIQSMRKIHLILEEELKKYIHSVQILIN